MRFFCGQDIKELNDFKSKFVQQELDFVDKQRDVGKTEKPCVCEKDGTDRF